MIAAFMKRSVAVPLLCEGGTVVVAVAEDDGGEVDEEIVVEVLEDVAIEHMLVAKLVF